MPPLQLHIDILSFAASGALARINWLDLLSPKPDMWAAAAGCLLWAKSGTFAA
jgi:hypothetical protein